MTSTNRWSSLSLCFSSSFSRSPTSSWVWQTHSLPTKTSKRTYCMFIPQRACWTPSTFWVKTLQNLSTRNYAFKFLKFNTRSLKTLLLTKFSWMLREKQLQNKSCIRSKVKWKSAECSWGALEMASLELNFKSLVLTAQEWWSITFIKSLLIQITLVKNSAKNQTQWLEKRISKIWLLGRIRLSAKWLCKILTESW